MKKILILLGYGELGGAERQAIYVAEGLARKNYRVQVICFGVKGLCNEILDQKKISNKNISLQAGEGRWARVKNLVAVYRAIISFQPAVVIPFTINPNVYANSLKPVLPFTRTIWNQRDAGVGAQKSRIERFALKKANHVIANSISGKDFLINHFNIDSNSIKIIPNGVEIPGRIIQASSMHVGMIGNLHKYKDVKTVLHAWQLFKNHNQDTGARLLIAGRDDGMLAEYLLLIKQLGIADSVEFCGQQKNIHAFIDKLQLGIHSGIDEGSPNAILEMMSHGLPVIANDIPGNRSVLGSGDMYFTTGDVAGLADLLERSIRFPDQLEEKGKKNLLRVKEEFSMEALINNYESLVNA